MNNEEILAILKKMSKALGEHALGNNQMAKRFFADCTNSLIWSLEIPPEIKYIAKSIDSSV